MRLDSNEIFNKLPDKGIGIVQYSVGASPNFFNIQLAEKWLRNNKNVIWISGLYTEEQFKVLAGKFGLRTASKNFYFKEIATLFSEHLLESSFSINNFVDSIKKFSEQQKDDQLIIFDNIDFICDLINSDYKEVLKILCEIGSYFNNISNGNTLICSNISERFCNNYQPNFYNLNFYVKIEEYNSGLDDKVSGKIDIIFGDEEKGIIYHDFLYLVKDRSVKFIPTGVGAV
uniref:ATPase domain-containing protein n=1 Tax=Strongyloides stercoralis TaxID=6248 RepID=A0A0K0EHE5_STRER